MSVTRERLSEGETALLLSRDNLVLRDGITNSRVVLFSCSAYRSMCDALYDQFQSGAGVILYRMGEGYARKLLGAVPKLGLNTQEVIQGFERLAFLCGWGKLKFRTIDERNAECEVERCAFVLRRPDIGSTSCFFFSGVLSTVGRELLKNDFKVQEVSCESSGSPLCRFRLFVD